MDRALHIHVVDPDSRRRAKIAFQLAASGLHVEIYDSLSELAAAEPRFGVLLMADTDSECCIAEYKAAGLFERLPLPVAGYAPTPPLHRAVAAIQDGALDYLNWPLDPLLLEATLTRLRSAARCEDSRWQSERTARAAVSLLSAREIEVLACMVAGNSNKGIGELLGISPRTVEIHRGNMMRKLKARSQSDALRLALLAGVTMPTTSLLAA